MKKKLISAMTTALVFGATATTFAATNPFSDVPAGHWAYDAVTELASKGIVEGYGDGTYLGNRNITRYEMAQMIAKAMAKNPTGTDKATLDRLAAEFADELNNLGVRVSNLEKYADKLTWTGELRFLYWNNREEKADGSKPKSNTNRMELRLFPTAEVNKHWTLKARITARDNMKTDSSTNLSMTYAYAQGKYKNFGIAVGKMSNYSYNDEGLVIDDYFSGAQITVGSKLQAMLEAGRWNLGNGGNGNINVAFADDAAANYQGIQLNYNVSKLFFGAGYRHFNSDDFRGVANYSRKNDEDSANIWSVGASYKFDKNFAIAGAFGKNTKADERDTGHSIKISYKGANRKQANTWGIYAAYRYISPFVSLAPTYDTMGFKNNRKGYEIGLSYVPMKNLLTDIAYFDGKQLDTDRDSDTLWCRARLYF